MPASQPSSRDQNRTLRVRSGNYCREIDYESVEASHSGNSWWGCTVAFRAMQLVSHYLSEDGYWNIDNLYIVSGHPGPGVLDTIELVTGCCAKNRFRTVLDNADTRGCSRDMHYDWWISNGRQTIHIHLLDDFIPEEFYEVLDRVLSDNNTASDDDRFDRFKQKLSAELWQSTLESVFETRVLPPLAPGELPGA